MSEDDGRVVCVVDDDASLRRSLRNLLMSVGFRVETFQSARSVSGICASTEHRLPRARFANDRNERSRQRGVWPPQARASR